MVRRLLLGLMGDGRAAGKAGACALRQHVTPAAAPSPLPLLRSSPPAGLTLQLLILGPESLQDGKSRPKAAPLPRASVTGSVLDLRKVGGGLRWGAARAAPLHGLRPADTACMGCGLWTRLRLV